MKKYLAICALFMAGVACSVSASEQFPSKGVQINVGYSPGGATDIIARYIANGLTKKWQQQVIVNNKAGAGGMIATEFVVRSSADGYQLLLAYTPEASINALTFKNMRYDPEQDLTPIALIATAPLILVGGKGLKENNMAEIMSRTRRGITMPLTYGSAGAGGQQHIGGELLRLETGVPFVHVPFKGTADAVMNTITGTIDVVFASSPPIINHIRAGTLKPLFVAGSKRQQQLPDVPTASEVGLRDFDIPTWFGLLGPKGMSKELVKKISDDVRILLADENSVKPLLDQGLTIEYRNPDQFKEFISQEMNKYRTIISRMGLEKQ